jgi:hypothetical protein
MVTGIKTFIASVNGGLYQNVLGNFIIKTGGMAKYRYLSNFLFMKREKYGISKKSGKKIRL